jgi:hypothetical protein
MAVWTLSEFVEQVARLQIVGSNKNAGNHCVQQSPTAIVTRVDVAHRYL